MKARRILASVAAAAVATSALAVAASAYNGYIGLQTQGWSFRDSWDNATTGKGTPYFDHWSNMADGDSEKFPDYEDYFDYDVTSFLLPATYTDVTIDKDGTYTVKAADIVWDLAKETSFNLVFVSTDIPQNEDPENPTVVCTEAKIIVDGEVVKTVENPINDTTQKYFNVSLANTWNADIGSYGDLPYPTESLAIEFTITGLDAEGGDAGDAEGGDTGAGDVDGETDGGKDSPDTGIEDVAVVAGLAIVAGGAIAITRKRK